MPALLRSDTDLAGPITCLLSDVDGVMTDGRIVYDDGLLESKRFHVRDGLGIQLWLATGFQFGILTARTSPIVAHRASELGITHVRQGCGDKRAAAEAMVAEMGCTSAEVCYVGDDLPDIGVMNWAGLAAAPADAAEDVRSAANWVLRQAGGSGAVRELVERLLRAKGRWEEHVPG